MTIVFATNDPIDFPGAGVSTNTAHFRSAYVSRALSMAGNSTAFVTTAITKIPPVLGKITWIHFRYAKSSDFNSLLSDGNAVLSLQSGDGTTILDFDILDAAIRIRLFGSSTLTANVGDNLRKTSPLAIDLKIDLTTDISVELFVDGVSQYNESQAWTSNPGNPELIYWRAFDATPGTFTQYISELIIADENTVGTAVSELVPDATGNYSEWLGDHVETGDNDLGTGASTDEGSKKLSSVMTSFIGPASSAIRAIVVNTKASTRGEVKGLRNFLRIASSDYSGEAVNIGEGIENHVTVWNTNPDTSVDWDTANFSGVELGIESLVPMAYQYYKIDITAVNGGGFVACDELQMFDAEGTNLTHGTSYGATMSGSSRVSYVNGYDGVYRLYGNNLPSQTDGWFSNNTVAAWTQITFDDPHELTSCVLMAQSLPAMFKDFTFQYSDNGSDFTVALTVTGETDWIGFWPERTFSWESVGAHRYWRIDITDNNGDVLTGCYNIRYINAAGEVIAPVIRKFIVRAQTNFDSGVRPYKMFNDTAGSPGLTTAWLSTARTTERVDIAAPVPVTVKSIRWHVYKPIATFHNSEMPKDFTVEGSNDGSTWDVLLTVTGETRWDGGFLEFNLF